MRTALAPISDTKPRRTIAARISRMLLFALAALGTVVVVVSLTPAVQWMGYALAGPWRDPNGEVLIVLAGSMMGDGIIGQSSYLRSVYAVRAYREKHFKYIVISGGGKIPEAVLMARFMQAEGVPANVILTESLSGSTRQNALFSAPLLAGLPDGKVLLTSDYHMFRSRRVFQKAGVQVATMPIPDAIKRGSTWRGRWPAFLDVCTECAKIVYYRAHGWI